MENVITVWERLARMKNGLLKWEHNHISDGYDSHMKIPKAVDTRQEKLWQGVKWRSSKAYLINGKVEHTNFVENN